MLIIAINGFINSSLFVLSHTKIRPPAIFPAGPSHVITESSDFGLRPVGETQTEIERMPNAFRYADHQLPYNVTR